MELEFFCKPEKHQEWFDYWKNYSYNFLLELGIQKENLKLKDHTEIELSHYSNATSDILFNFPWGFDELWGIASRTDFDLKNHQKYSKKDLQYFDETTKEKFLPFVIEPSLGVERLFLALLANGLVTEKKTDDTFRTFLKIHPFLAPYKLAILPLMKKNHRLKAKELQKHLSNYFELTYDENQSIGKRYRRQDLIGNPFCCTVDDQTLEDNTVTIRERDSMLQHRISINQLRDYIEKKILF
jgi:glycyl-tRNA synthetase